MENRKKSIDNSLSENDAIKIIKKYGGKLIKNNEKDLYNIKNPTKKSENKNAKNLK